MATLSSIFSDGAVFAANHPIRVFGTGDGQVEVSFLGAVRRAESTKDSWCVTFDPLPYGGPYEMRVLLDDEETILHDLWIGEVLLCAGQSNMEFRMFESKDYPDRCEPNPMLRAFYAERVDQRWPLRPKDGWKKCDTDEVIKNVSAIGYQSGLLLSKRLGCAVGVIVAAQGASVIQSWIPEGALERIGICFDGKALAACHAAHPQWNVFGRLYQTMLKPWVNYAVSNVVWYQGESNASDAESAVYEKMLAEMIRLWRMDFQDPALPFTIIQIADFQGNAEHHSAWCIVQEAQLRIQEAIANVTTVISADVCETDNIHPPTKWYISERVAAAIVEARK